MPKGLSTLSALAIAAVLTLPLPAAVAAESEPDADTVVATVNGKEITLGHMIIAQASLPPQYTQMPADALYDAILDQLIKQEALSQAETGDLPRYVALSLENEHRSLLAGEEIRKAADAAGDEADVNAAYKEMLAGGFDGDEFNASHILVESEDEAKAIKTQLDEGADFAELAKEKSTGPSGPNGGALGWFGKGAMVPEFEAAVVSLEPGQVSDPVQTQFGWHVILLSETRKQTAPELDEIRDQIVDQLRTDAIDARIEKATRDANIERPVIEGLNPDVIRNLDLVRN